MDSHSPLKDSRNFLLCPWPRQPGPILIREGPSGWRGRCLWGSGHNWTEATFSITPGRLCFRPGVPDGPGSLFPNSDIFKVSGGLETSPASVTWSPWGLQNENVVLLPQFQACPFPTPGGVIFLCQGNPWLDFPAVLDFPVLSWVEKTTAAGDSDLHTGLHLSSLF